MGLDVYLQKGEDSSIELDSEKYPKHLFQGWIFPLQLQWSRDEQRAAYAWLAYTLRDHVGR